MSWLKKICVGLIVASSLMIVTPSTTEAQRVVVRGRVGGGYAGWYSRPNYGYRSYYRPYVYRNRYWGPAYGGRVYVATPRVRVVW